MKITEFLNRYFILDKEFSDGSVSALIAPACKLCGDYVYSLEMHMRFHHGVIRYPEPEEETHEP